MTPSCVTSSNVRAAFVLASAVVMFQVRSQGESVLTTAERSNNVTKALAFVKRIEESDNCTEGTENTLALEFNTTDWEVHTSPAVRTANFLSQLLTTNYDTFNKVEASLFYDFVRNNVHGNTLIFGSAVALEPSLGPDGVLHFAPYASKQAGGVRVSEIRYQYTGTEWYDKVRRKDVSQVDIVSDNVTINGKTYIMKQAVANVTHGIWTQPYYDCGAGDIWMVTFSAPILALNSSDFPVFGGVATIDLELTQIDINQCDLDENDKKGSLDIFRGTHNCQPTTKCEPMKQGFKSGSYRCVCLDGFYFPNTGAQDKSFDGRVIDEYIANGTNPTDTNKFRCLQCPRACDTCVDDTPCLYEYNLPVRVLVVLIVCLLVVGCGMLSLVTFKFRAVMVMKTASPMFLQIMIWGAAFMCLSVFVLYPEATNVLCTLAIWPFHLGFSLLYGSLILKTWRISVIFNQRKKVNLPDKVLLQRLVPFPALTTVYLACWTVLQQPRSVVITMQTKKKFFACSFDYWNYAVFGVEALLLLFGVYLCFTVRKAPAHFNESKHITWSTYNAIILGVFIITLTQFLTETAGPDVVYVLQMLQLQVFVTITLCLIFAPKLWALYRGTQLESPAAGGPTTVTGRQLTNINTTVVTNANKTFANVSTQVNPDDFIFIPPAKLPSPVHEADSGLSKRPASRLRSNAVSPMPNNVGTSSTDEVLLKPVLLSPPRDASHTTSL